MRPPGGDIGGLGFGSIRGTLGVVAISAVLCGSGSACLPGRKDPAERRVREIFRGREDAKPNDLTTGCAVLLNPILHSTNGGSRLSGN